MINGEVIKIKPVDALPGRRVFTDEKGFLPSFETGDYGRATADILVEYTKDWADKTLLWWQLRAPDGSACCLNPKVHTITEHEDGTITVMPSILTATWHGFLIQGNWYNKWTK